LSIHLASVPGGLVPELFLWKVLNRQLTLKPANLGNAGAVRRSGGLSAGKGGLFQEAPGLISGS
jgi:hypothetical protein